MTSVSPKDFTECTYSRLMGYKDQVDKKLTILRSKSPLRPEANQKNVTPLKNPLDTNLLNQQKSRKENKLINRLDKIISEKEKKILVSKTEKIAKDQHELLKECTFKPNLHPSQKHKRGTSYCAPQARNTLDQEDWYKKKFHRKIESTCEYNDNNPTFKPILNSRTQKLAKGIFDRGISVEDRLLKYGRQREKKIQDLERASLDGLFVPKRFAPKFIRAKLDKKSNCIVEGTCKKKLRSGYKKVETPESIRKQILIDKMFNDKENRDSVRNCERRLNFRDEVKNEVLEGKENCQNYYGNLNSLNINKQMMISKFDKYIGKDRLETENENQDDFVSGLDKMNTLRLKFESSELKYETKYMVSGDGKDIHYSRNDSSKVNVYKNIYDKPNTSPEVVTPIRSSLSNITDIFNNKQLIVDKEKVLPQAVEEWKHIQQHNNNYSKRENYDYNISHQTKDNFMEVKEDKNVINEIIEKSINTIQNHKNIIVSKNTNNFNNKNYILNSSDDCGDISDGKLDEILDNSNNNKLSRSSKNSKENDKQNGMDMKIQTILRSLNNSSLCTFGSTEQLQQNEPISKLTKENSKQDKLEYQSIVNQSEISYIVNLTPDNDRIQSIKRSHNDISINNETDFINLNQIDFSESSPNEPRTIDVGKMFGSKEDIILNINQELKQNSIKSSNKNSQESLSKNLQQQKSQQSTLVSSSQRSMKSSMANLRSGKVRMTKKEQQQQEKREKDLLVQQKKAKREKDWKTKWSNKEICPRVYCNGEIQIQNNYNIQQTDASTRQNSQQTLAIKQKISQEKFIRISNNTSQSTQIIPPDDCNIGKTLITFDEERLDISKTETGVKQETSESTIVGGMSRIELFTNSSESDDGQNGQFLGQNKEDPQDFLRLNSSEEREEQPRITTPVETTMKPAGDIKLKDQFAKFITSRITEAAVYMDNDREASNQEKQSDQNDRQSPRLLTISQYNNTFLL